MTALGTYNRIWLDDFSAGRNASWWSAYNGTPAGLDGVARWNSANLTATNGTMNFATTLAPDGVYESAGTSSANALDAVPALNAARGMWGFRYRIDAGTSIGHVILLYPKGGDWPPELDIVEDAGGDRQSAVCTVHWKDSAGVHQQKRLGTITHDFTQWTTVYVTVERKAITIEIDGVTVISWDGTASDGTDISAAAIPSVPMWLGAQTHRKTNTVTPSTPLPTMQIDWVAKFQQQVTPTTTSGYGASYGASYGA